MNHTVLVPTDFSENAWIATQYAAEFCLDRNKKLVLIHSFHAFYSSFTIEQNVQMLEEAKKIVNAEMDLISDKLKNQYPELEYETHCLQGILHEVINSENEKNPFDLIVMGTKGATGLRYTLMGSNTYDVINRSPIPVLAVPHESRFNLQKVGVLSNYKNTEITVLNKFINIVGNDFSAVLLHVHEADNGFEQAYAESWKELVTEQTGLQDLNYKVGKGEKVREVVNDLMEDEKIDLLLVTNNARSFIQSLFKRDLVKSLALKPQIPVLFVKP